MSRLRFNHVFLGLLLGSALCAFLVPLRYGHYVRGSIDGLFTPVAHPVRRLAELVTRRLTPRATVAGADVDLKGLPAAAQTEIARLRAAVAELTMQNAELLRRQKSQQLKGNVQEYSVACRVIGADASRDALSLAGTSFDGLAARMPVVYRDFLVGRVVAAGPGGSLVRLVSDRGFRVNGAFGRFNGTEFVPIVTPPPLVEGRGTGLMTITNLSLKEIEKKVQVGDWVVLQDADDWPLALNGYQIGRVEKIEPLPRSMLFALVTVRPAVDLLQLREVMVVAHTPARGVVEPAKAGGGGQRPR